MKNYDRLNIGRTSKKISFNKVCCMIVGYTAIVAMVVCVTMWFCYLASV
jgi:hypothetical protein